MYYLFIREFRSPPPLSLATWLGHERGRRAHLDGTTGETGIKTHSDPRRVMNGGKKKRASSSSVAYGQRKRKGKGRRGNGAAFAPARRGTEEEEA